MIPCPNFVMPEEPQPLGARFEPAPLKSHTQVIFLDVDGVLNCVRSVVAFGGIGNAGNSKNWHKYDDIALRLIRGASKNANAPIVLSSTWRKVVDLEEFATYYDLNIIDKTPSLVGVRGVEIKDWLDRHPEITNYAIIDDDSDMLPEQMDHFVKTDGFEGFGFKNFKRLCEILEIAPYGINHPRGNHGKDSVIIH